MLLVNGEKLEFKEGMTIKDILIAKKYSFPLLVVSVNGKHIPRENFSTVEVSDNSKIQVIHLMSGG